MYVSWKPKSRSVNLYNDNGAIIRRFNSNSEIVDAVINGAGKDANIAVTTKDGKTIVYRSNGTIVRRS